ncbi:mechanosensitive ion channel protein MscS [Haloferula helveola]|uniref:Mechanosensitive ion channel protein MscS n=1 Tax=Haloferula helveola TaxID=490095 RepID=A0ABM7RIY7_9BACT|nr:mechanosensitive ion channel protein MscS [Haloferula helveola]
MAVLILGLPLLRAQNPAEELATGDSKPPIPEDLVIPTDIEVTDKAIRERLLSIYSQMDELKTLEVDALAGVVTLRGTAREAEDIEVAVALAEKTEGVVFVRNRIERQLDVESRLSPAMEKAHSLWRAGVRAAPLFLIAVISALVMWAIGRWLAGRKSFWSRFGLSPLGLGLLQRTIRMAFLLIGITIGLEILDATALAGALLGVAGVVGIALGFAFRNIVENYLAGVLLSMRNPFSPGDVVEVGGSKGKVIRLTSRDTVLMTPDGNHLRIPNRLFMDSELLNLTRNPRRRFDFAVGVSVEQDLVATRELGLETVSSVTGVLDDPAPWAVVEELGDSTVNLRFFAWLDQRDSDFLKTRSEAIRRIKETFDDAGIEMPEPIYRVHLTEKKNEPAQAAAKGPMRSSTSAAARTATDTGADDTLDRQIELSEAGAKEENLLSDKE